MNELPTTIVVDVFMAHSLHSVAEATGTNRAIATAETRLIIKQLQWSLDTNPTRRTNLQGMHNWFYKLIRTIASTKDPTLTATELLGLGVA